MYDDRFQAPDLPVDFPGEMRRDVPLVTVRDLDREAVAEVAVKFIDFPSKDSLWVVVSTMPDDDDNMAYVHGDPPFASAKDAAQWAEKTLAPLGHQWAAAPLFRTGVRQDAG